MVRAFSLIETLAVVCVLGIVAAIALPPMLPQVHRAQLGGESEAIAGFVSRARVEALVRKRCVRVVITRASNPVELTLEALNTFDCDHQPHTAARIDPALPLWLTIATMKVTTPTLSVAFDPAPGESTAGAFAGLTPAHTGEVTQLRYRPTGRLWSADDVITDDDGVLRVTHARMASGENTVKILADAAGSICVLKRGQNPVGSGNDLGCP